MAVAPPGQVESAFPPVMSDLHARGKLRLQIVSLQAGSLVAKLRVTVQDPEFPVGVSTLAPMLPRLWASRVFQIDRRGTSVQGRVPSPHPERAAKMPSDAHATVFPVSVDCIPKGGYG